MSLAAPSFDSLKTLTSTAVSDSSATYLATIDPIFTIGPKVHGGSMQLVCAAAALRGFSDTAGDSEIAAGLAPVAVASNYLTAPDPAEVTLLVQIRKRGRRVSLVDVEVQQGGRTMIHTTVTLAVPDTGPGHWSAVTQARSPLVDMPVAPTENAVFVEQSPMASVVNLAAAVDLAYDPDTTAFARGERGHPEYRFWVKPKGADPDGLFAIFAGDVSAPVVMNLQLFGWAPTLQLSTYLRRQPHPGWLRGQITTVDVGEEWFDEDHVIIDSTGLVVAQSRQLALVPKAFG